MRLLPSSVSVSFVILTTAVACSTPRPETPQVAPESPPAPGYVLTGTPERRVFTLTNEVGDTVSTDSYARTAEALEGEIRIYLPGAKFRRARYRVEFDSQGLAVHTKLTFLRESTPTGEPVLGEFTTVLHPNGTVEEARDEGTAVRYQAGVGVVPWFPPSAVTVQEIIRRAHRLTGGRGRVEIPHFPLASGGQGIGTAIITFVAPGSVEISYGPGSGPVRYAVDRQGRLLGGGTAEGWCLTVEST